MVERTWSAVSNGIEFRMSTVVNGQMVASIYRVNDEVMARSPVPATYIERELKHRLMRGVEELLVTGKIGGG